ncbi:protein LOL2 [Senna tora]|uniref:Protein LOL2 n=1 Tax=Senna tora TaxID=362788 RepID=A0A834XA32_9FABA|nr:protein LOL2 [Senna tora]
MYFLEEGNSTPPHLLSYRRAAASAPTDDDGTREAVLPLVFSHLPIGLADIVSQSFVVAHEVGQVKCGSCAVLLMYPFGASQVRCSSCCFVTEIGEQNSRPPLSVLQQEQNSRPPLSVLQQGKATPPPRTAP